MTRSARTMDVVTPDTYHHGDLRGALLAEAAAAITEQGVEALSLRELSRRAGVSHAAPTHHFIDKRGLLTALATEGFRLLSIALRGASGDLLEAAVAYVRFATVEHPGHYAVMYAAAAIDAEDPGYLAARADSEVALLEGVAGVRTNTGDGQSPFAPLAAFSLVHGLASLWNSGALAARYGDLGAEALAREIAPLLFSRP
ncbi:MAG: transcriptional regulator [Microbacteriaceae bacterium]|nr:transcriptional regulator [Microbacteriaceae bacterium]